MLILSGLLLQALAGGVQLSENLSNPMTVSSVQSKLAGKIGVYDTLLGIIGNSVIYASYDENFSDRSQICMLSINFINTCSQFRTASRFLYPTLQAVGKDRFATNFFREGSYIKLGLFRSQLNLVGEYDEFGILQNEIIYKFNFDTGVELFNIRNKSHRFVNWSLPKMRFNEVITLVPFDKSIAIITSSGGIFSQGTQYQTKSYGVTSTSSTNTNILLGSKNIISVLDIKFEKIREIPVENKQACITKDYVVARKDSAIMIYSLNSSSSVKLAVSTSQIACSATDNRFVYKNLSGQTYISSISQ